MAKRRMFSLDIVDTDIFLDMPASTQNLYFHLGMRADDDGFISSARKITSMVNCSNDDLKLLIAKGFIIAFQSGIYVVRDWKINNAIRPDRYKPTAYIKEKADLEKMLKSDGMTFGIPNGYQTDTKCTPNDIPLVSTGKDSIGKYSTDKNSIDTNIKDINNTVHSNSNEEQADFRDIPTLPEVKAYCSERGNIISAIKFYTYYDEREWAVNGKPIEDWRALFRYWEGREKDRNQCRGNPKTDEKPSRFKIEYTVDGTKM